MKMETDTIIDLLKVRIKTCYESLLFSRNQQNYPKEYIEGFRCRLDELILLYHLIFNISFVEACKELGIKYEDINIQEGTSHK